MEDHSSISLILEGCKSAKDLESNLPSLANKPDMLVRSIDAIITTFTTAKHRYLMVNNVHHDPSSQQHWLQYGMSIAEDDNSGKSHQFHQTTKASSSRTKKDDDVDQRKRTIRLPAPLMGNTELPPDDCYTWRKYGQKEILGSMYPRSYYRCTHQKMYNCAAKKQVQRLDDDPYMFQVTYIGDHTCHMSATAPSNNPPPSTQSIEVAQSSMPMFPMDRLITSLGQYNSRGEVEYPAVADLADAMFNSGSSSSNSMEFIFPCVDDRKN